MPLSIAEMRGVATVFLAPPKRSQNILNAAIICGFCTADQNRCTDNDSQHTRSLFVSYARVNRQTPKSTDGNSGGVDASHYVTSGCERWAALKKIPNISLCDVKITIPRDGSTPPRGCDLSSGDSSIEFRGLSSGDSIHNFEGTTMN